MVSISNKRLKKLTYEVIEVAEHTGLLLKKYYRQIDKLKISAKEAAGVVSIADKKSEEFILKKLKKIMPEIPFLAEEMTYEKHADSRKYMNQFIEKEYCWIIDPLDGTTNFLNGLDYFAICISLAFKGKPILGVVYNPITQDCFYAWKDGGAWYKNSINKAKKLYKAKNQKSLREGLFVTGFATEKGKLFNQEFSQFRKMMDKTRGIRRMGSAALDLCHVAKGTFDGFWEYGLAPWDVAAAGCICIEAGVQVTDYEGQAFSPFQISILAVRKPLYSSFSQVFRSK